MAEKALEKLSDSELTAKYLESLSDDELSKLYSDSIASKESTAKKEVRASTAPIASASEPSIITKAANAVDTYTGDAPLRAGVYEMVKGGSFDTAKAAAINKFKNPQSSVASGKDIALALGGSDKPIEVAGIKKGVASFNIPAPILIGAYLSGGSEAVVKLREKMRDASPADLEGIALDFGLSPTAILGPVVKGASKLGLLSKISEVADTAGKGLRGAAERKAFKALGPTKAQEKLAKAKGYEQAVGGAVLDEGIVTPFASKSKIAERAAEKASQAGEAVDEVIKQASGGGEVLIDSTELGLNILQNPQIAKLKTSKLAEIRANYDKVSKLANDIADGGDMTIEQLRSFRQEVDSLINYNKLDQTGYKAVLEDVRRVLAETINEAANLTGRVSKDAIKAANKKFSNLKKASDLSAGGAAAEATNRAIGLTDTIAGAGGLVAGANNGPLGALAGAAVAGAINKISRKYGSTTAAYALDKMAEAMKNIPGLMEILAKNPESAPALVQVIVKSSRENGPTSSITENQSSKTESQNAAIKRRLERAN